MILDLPNSYTYYYGSRDFSIQVFQESKIWTNTYFCQKIWKETSGDYSLYILQSFYVDFVMGIDIVIKCEMDYMLHVVYVLHNGN
jgi:hypothetical protein